VRYELDRQPGNDWAATFLFFVFHYSVGDFLQLSNHRTSVVIFQSSLKQHFGAGPPSFPPLWTSPPHPVRRWRRIIPGVCLRLLHLLLLVLPLLFVQGQQGGEAALRLQGVRHRPGRLHLERRALHRPCWMAQNMAVVVVMVDAAHRWGCLISTLLDWRARMWYHLCGFLSVW
jgi:hypothetical protein